MFKLNIPVKKNNIINNKTFTNKEKFRIHTWMGKREKQHQI
jgi:hypothetical protein